MEPPKRTTNPIGTDYNDINDILALKGRQINQGTNSKGTQYNRNIDFEDGYEELAKIVAGLGKEVKRINQCLTKAGAIEYARKRMNWTAHEADITGPNGEPDGVKEVFVCDADGKVKVINGVGLRKSTFPLRKAYFTMHGTNEARKATPFNQFKKSLTQINEQPDENGNPFYVMTDETLGNEFKGIRKEITPFELYKQKVFQPVYDDMKAELISNGVQPLTLAHVYNKALRTGFNNHVKKQVLAQLLEDDPDNVSKNIVQKALKSEDYLTESQGKILTILGNGDDFTQCQQELHDLIGSVTEEEMTKLERSFNVSQLSPHKKRDSPFKTPRK